jgi:hypothetical protein
MPQCTPPSKLILKEKKKKRPSYEMLHEADYLPLFVMFMINLFHLILDLCALG